MRPVSPKPGWILQKSLKAGVYESPDTLPYRTPSNRRTMMTILLGLGAALAVAALGAWLVLLLARGGFWRTDVRLPATDPAASPSQWPALAVVVPARNESAVLPRTLPALLGQDYPANLHVYSGRRRKRRRHRRNVARAIAADVGACRPPDGHPQRAAAARMDGQDLGHARRGEGRLKRQSRLRPPHRCRHSPPSRTRPRPWWPRRFTTTSTWSRRWPCSASLPSGTACSFRHSSCSSA